MHWNSSYAAQCQKPTITYTAWEHACKVQSYCVLGCASCMNCIRCCVSHHNALSYLGFVMDIVSWLYGYNLELKVDRITLNAAGSNPSDHGLHGWQSWHCWASAVPWGQCPCCRRACKLPFISVFILILATVPLLLVSVVLTDQSSACFWAQQSRWVHPKHELICSIICAIWQQSIMWQQAIWRCKHNRLITLCWVWVMLPCMACCRGQLLWWLLLLGAMWPSSSCCWLTELIQQWRTRR